MLPRLLTTLEFRSNNALHQPLIRALALLQKYLQSRVRIFIEHAIGGMKRYHILVHTFRNRIEHFEDDVIGICAGLWNLALSY